MKEEPSRVCEIRRVSMYLSFCLNGLLFFISVITLGVWPADDARLLFVCLFVCLFLAPSASQVVLSSLRVTVSKLQPLQKIYGPLLNFNIHALEKQVAFSSKMCPIAAFSKSGL